MAQNFTNCFILFWRLFLRLIYSSIDTTLFTFYFIITVVTAGNEDDFIDVEGDENLLQQYAQQQQQNSDHIQQGIPSVIEGASDNDFSQVFEQMDDVSADDVMGVGGMAEGGGYTAAGMEEFEFTGGEFDEEGNFDGKNNF